MKQKQKKFIHANAAKMTTGQIASHLGLRKKQVLEFLETERPSRRGTGPERVDVPNKDRSGRDAASSSWIAHLHSLDPYELCALGVAGLLLVYGILRACRVSICHDESCTYFFHVLGSWRQIFFEPIDIPANNHLINTLLIKLFTWCFGDAELVLRLPALLGFALYLVACFGILRLFLKKTKLLLGFFLLTTNPFLIDFFTCARGYSLGLGFFMMSVFIMLRYAVSGATSLPIKSALLALCWATLSALSNFSFIHTYLAMVLLLTAAETTTVASGANEPAKKYFSSKRFRHMATALGVSLLTLFTIYSPKAIKAILLDSEGVGGKKGLWVDTVRSLIEASLHEQNYGAWVFPAVQGLIWASLIVALTLVFWRLFLQRRGHETALLVTILLLILIPLVLIKLSAVLFRSNYAEDRSVIYLVPLFYLVYLGIWKCAGSFPLRPSRTLGNILGGGLVCLMIGHGFLCMNTDHFFIMKYDASTKEAMRMLRERHALKGKPGREYKIGVNWLFKPAVNYYIIRENMTWLKRADKNGPDDEAHDYYYLMEEDKPLIQKRGLKVLAYFRSTKSYLAELELQ